MNELVYLKYNGRLCALLELRIGRWRRVPVLCDVATKEVYRSIDIFALEPASEDEIRESGK